MDDYIFLLTICASTVILFFGSLAIAASMLSSICDQEEEKARHD